MTNYINQAIELAKNLKTDIFGFGNAVYKKKPTQFNDIKDRWNEEVFPNLEIEVEVDLKLTAKGTINSFIEVNS